VEKVKPSRPRKAKRKVVKPPEEAKTENKYAPKMKVGKPTIKAPGTNQVTTVGLGKLTVITQNGNTNV
jgi:hypothetical protein